MFPNAAMPPRLEIGNDEMMNLWKVSAVAAAAVAVAGCTQSETDMVDLSPHALAAAKASGYEMSKVGKDGGELHIYTWSDYIAPEVLVGFEKALGVRVVVDTFDSNEAMYAKLKAGSAGYDIMMPTSYQIATMAKEKMIVEIDHSRVPNLKDFDVRFANQIIDPTFKYNVPYSVTYAGFIYSKERIPESADINSWQILENPAFKGRVTLLDDIRETLGAALMSLGYSINSADPGQLSEAADQIIKWRANVRKFDAESYKTEVAAGSTWIGHGYSTDSVQVIVGDADGGMEPRDDIGFALPKEGFSIAFDEMVLATNARRPDLAYAFMNYVYDPEVAKVNMEYICGPVPTKKGIELLDEDYRALIVLDEATIARGQILRGFDDCPDVMELYNKAWDRVKATEVYK